MAAMAMTVPIDTARTRLILGEDNQTRDEKAKLNAQGGSAFAVIWRLAKEEGMSVY